MTSRAPYLNRRALAFILLIGITAASSNAATQELEPVPPRRAPSSNALTDHVANEERRAATKKAQEDFARDVGAHTLVKCCMGGESPQRGFDSASGMPLRCVTYGCIVRGRDIVYVDAYNKLLAQWLAQNGIPEWSRKVWQQELASAWAFFEARSEDGEIESVIPGNRKARSDDGRWIAHIVPSDTGTWGTRQIGAIDHGGFGAPRAILTLVRRPHDTAFTCAIWSLDASDCEFAWGPKGSDLLGLRWRRIQTVDEDTDTIWSATVLDLRTGSDVLIQTESSMENQRAANMAALTRERERIRDSIRRTPITIYRQTADGKVAPVRLLNPLRGQQAGDTLRDTLNQNRFPEKPRKR